jgi:hypothetical protein
VTLGMMTLHMFGGARTAPAARARVYRLTLGISAIDPRIGDDGGGEP